MKSHYNGLQLNGYNQRGLPIGLSHQKKMNRTPVKIKDALFVSAENIARDLPFIQNQNITNIVNLCSNEIDNYWIRHNIKYTSYPWRDAPSQVIAMQGDKVLKPIFELIDRVVDSGEAILIHSVKGMNRSVVVLLAYLMSKYSWSLDKATTYYKCMMHKDDTFNVKGYFITQLKSFEKFLINTQGKTLSEDFAFKTGVYDEEQLLVNTYLNTIKQGYQHKKEKVSEGEKRSICWRDELVELIPVQDLRRLGKAEEGAGEEEASTGGVGQKNKFKKRSRADADDLLMQRLRRYVANNNSTNGAVGGVGLGKVKKEGAGGKSPGVAANAQGRRGGSVRFSEQVKPVGVRVKRGDLAKRSSTPAKVISSFQRQKRKQKMLSAKKLAPETEESDGARPTSKGRKTVDKSVEKNKDNKNTNINANLSDKGNNGVNAGPSSGKSSLLSSPKKVKPVYSKMDPGSRSSPRRNFNGATQPENTPCEAQNEPQSLRTETPSGGIMKMNGRSDTEIPSSTGDEEVQLAVHQKVRASHPLGIAIPGKTPTRVMKPYESAVVVVDEKDMERSPIPVKRSQIQSNNLNFSKDKEQFSGSLEGSKGPSMKVSTLIHHNMVEESKRNNPKNQNIKVVKIDQCEKIRITGSAKKPKQPLAEPEGPLLTPITQNQHLKPETSKKSILSDISARNQTKTTKPNQSNTANLQKLKTFDPKASNPLNQSLDPRAEYFASSGVGRRLGKIANFDLRLEEIPSISVHSQSVKSMLKANTHQNLRKKTVRTPSSQPKINPTPNKTPTRPKRDPESNKKSKKKKQRRKLKKFPPRLPPKGLKYSLVAKPVGKISKNKNMVSSANNISMTIHKAAGLPSAQETPRKKEKKSSSSSNKKNFSSRRRTLKEKLDALKVKTAKQKKRDKQLNRSLAAAVDTKNLRSRQKLGSAKKVESKSSKRLSHKLKFTALSQSTDNSRHFRLAKTLAQSLQKNQMEQIITGERPTFGNNQITSKEGSVVPSKNEGLDQSKQAQRRAKVSAPAPPTSRTENLKVIAAQNLLRPRGDSRGSSRLTESYNTILDPNFALNVSQDEHDRIMMIHASSARESKNPDLILLDRGGLKKPVRNLSESRIEPFKNLNHNQRTNRPQNQRYYSPRRVIQPPESSVRGALEAEEVRNIRPEKQSVRLNPGTLKHPMKKSRSERQSAINQERRTAKARLGADNRQPHLSLQKRSTVGFGGRPQTSIGKKSTLNVYSRPQRDTSNTNNTQNLRKPGTAAGRVDSVCSQEAANFDVLIIPKSDRHVVGGAGRGKIRNDFIKKKFSSQRGSQPMVEQAGRSVTSQGQPRVGVRLKQKLRPDISVYTGAGHDEEGSPIRQTRELFRDARQTVGGERGARFFSPRNKASKKRQEEIKEKRAYFSPKTDLIGRKQAHPIRKTSGSIQASNENLLNPVALTNHSGEPLSNKTNKINNTGLKMTSRSGREPRVVRGSEIQPAQANNNIISTRSVRTTIQANTATNSVHGEVRNHLRRRVKAQQDASVEGSVGSYLKPSNFGNGSKRAKRPTNTLQVPELSSKGLNESFKSIRSAQNPPTRTAFPSMKARRRGMRNGPYSIFDDFQSQKNVKLYSNKTKANNPASTAGNPNNNTTTNAQSLATNLNNTILKDNRRRTRIGSSGDAELMQKIKMRQQNQHQHHQSTIGGIPSKHPSLPSGTTIKRMTDENGRVLQKSFKDTRFENALNKASNSSTQFYRKYGSLGQSRLEDELNKINASLKGVAGTSNAYRFRRTGLNDSRGIKTGVAAGEGGGELRSGTGYSKAGKGLSHGF